MSDLHISTFLLLYSWTRRPHNPKVTYYLIRTKDSPNSTFTDRRTPFILQTKHGLPRKALIGGYLSSVTALFLSCLRQFTELTCVDSVIFATDCFHKILHNYVCLGKFLMFLRVTACASATCNCSGIWTISSFTHLLSPRLCPCKQGSWFSSTVNRF